MAFSISPAAADVIRQRLERSPVNRPVAAMIDSSGSLPVSRELSEAVMRKADQSELKKIAKHEYNLEKLEFHLEVAIYSKSQHPFWTHTRVNGLEFALPLWVRLALRNWTLDFADNRFILRSGHRVRHTLLSAKRLGNAA